MTQRYQLTIHFTAPSATLYDVDEPHAMWMLDLCLKELTGVTSFKVEKVDGPSPNLDEGLEVPLSVVFPACQN